MAIQVKNMAELSEGDIVYMFSKDFPGTVERIDDYYGTVRVRDANGINTHLIAVARLLKPSPYVKGETYADAEGNYYVFQGEDANKVVAWKNTSRVSRSYDFPVRPLRLVSLGPELND